MSSCITFLYTFNVRYGEGKMKRVEIEITGNSALLHHRFAIEDAGENSSKMKKKVYVPIEEAEKAVFRNPDGTLYQPSEHILGALIKAGVKFKYEGKKTYKDLMKASIIIDPENIPLMNLNGEILTTWDEIDTRAVVIGRARIVRWRPRFNNWLLKFEATILDDDDIDMPTFKEIMEYAGKIGIGDYRPRFGRFMVTKFKVME